MLLVAVGCCCRVVVVVVAVFVVVAVIVVAVVAVVAVAIVVVVAVVVAAANFVVRSLLPFRVSCDQALVAVASWRCCGCCYVAGDVHGVICNCCCY